jgi:hypothetical protein
MTLLLDAVRTAGQLVGLPVTSSGVLAALSSATGIMPGTPFVLDVDAGPVRGQIPGVSLDTAGDGTHAHLTVPLQGASLSVATDAGATTVTAVGAPTLELDIGPAGVRWSASGPIELQAGPAHLPLPGPVPVALDIDRATLAIADGDLALGVTGTVQVDGIPSLPGPLSLPFEVHAGREGFTGSARGDVGSASFTVGWSQERDPFPSTIDVATPFTPPDAGAISGAAVTTGTSRVRVRLTRGVGGYAATIAVESGDDGVLSSNEPRVAALAVLVTATAGDTDAAPGTADAAEVAPLIATAAVLGTAMGSQGQARVTAVRFDTGNPDQVRVDYDAELYCAINAGILQATTPSPMRVVVRGATLAYGAATPTLCFAGAAIDVADTGRWEVAQPSGVLHVAGVRSGHGSSFFELDLRLAFDMGPVKVTGAVLRVALDNGVSVSLQGFSLGVDVPGLVSGEGRLSFDASGGFEAALRVSIKPLNLKASAGLTVEQADVAGHRFRSILADLAVDLPAPLPLANTGLGLFGIQALIGLNRSTKVEGDLKKRLEWRPDRDHTNAALDAQLFGAGVAIGTLPDLGVAFSALGRVVVRTPDIAIIAAVDARLLSSPRGVTDAPSTAEGVSLLGLFVVDPQVELYAGVTGSFRFPADTDWALLEVEVPVEARYPVQQPDRWFVHVGTDGKRGGCGPIRATVLPELFDIGAEAFLMLHGDGFDPPLDLPQSPTSGFAAAAGFSFSAKYGFPPVWADISVGAVVALGTRPLFVAGRAQAHGGLHLGPFSLGLDAVLTLQLGPGSTKYAELEACGSIDLWFFEISGCVHISFGGVQQRELDMPTNPLVSATVADRVGVASAGASALTAGTDGAPAMWPDGTVLLGFAPGPKYAGASTDPFHADLDQTSATKGAGTEAATDGRIGLSYPATWTLTSLGLERLTGGGTTAVFGPLHARWQLPPALAPKTPTSSRVLALFTENPALWSLSLLDGGASDPANPVGVRERGCRGSWSAEAGWAVGGRASPEDHGWRLPPLDDRPIPATWSSVRATVLTWMPAAEPLGHVPASRTFAALAAPGIALVTGQPPRTDPIEIDGYPTFPGVLLLADIVTGPQRQVEGYASTDIRSDDALQPNSRDALKPTLVLWSETDHQQELEVWTRTARGQVPWDLVDMHQAGRGGYVWVYVWHESEAVSVATVRHPRRWPLDDVEHLARPTLGVVAIGGVTAGAVNAAGNANAAGAAADVAAHTSASAQPPASAFTEGTVYRVDVTWSGALDNDPRPPVVETHHRHFRIAEHAPSPPEADALYRSVATFHPAMLGRYLAGYNVSGEFPWFVDDPIIATFSSRTIKPVASAYGYDLRVVVNRTDPPPGWAHDESPLLHQLFILDFVPSVQRPYLDAIDLLGISQLEPDCLWPRDAADSAAHPELVPNAAYEVGVLADPRDKNALGHPTLPHRAVTMLPRASFHTSRWRSPRDLFRALGFGIGAPVPRHVGVKAALARPTQNSDGAVRRSLHEAGVDLGPLDAAARTTMLWAPDGTGGRSVSAVVMEADEPIIRGRRLGAIELDNFWVSSDSGATMLLFIAMIPMSGRPFRLTWGEQQSQPTGAWSVTSSATLDVPTAAAVPELAWEVWP